MSAIEDTDRRALQTSIEFQKRCTVSEPSVSSRKGRDSEGTKNFSPGHDWLQRQIIATQKTSHLATSFGLKPSMGFSATTASLVVSVISTNCKQETMQLCLTMLVAFDDPQNKN